MFGTYSCTLLIHANHLDFFDIEDNLKLKPTRTNRKGDVISKTMDPLELDSWMYELEVGFFDEKEADVSPQTLNELINEMVCKIIPQKAFLHNLMKNATVRLRCFVQSEGAQIYFEISPCVLSKLSELGLEVEMSIFSWGGVVDDRSDEEKAEDERRSCQENDSHNDSQ